MADIGGRIYLTLGVHLFKRLKEQARIEGTTGTGIVRVALRVYLTARERERKEAQRELK